MMKQRWIVVVIGLPLLLAVLLACPDWATMLLVCAISAVADYELLHTAGKNISAPFYAGTMAAAAAQVFLLYWERTAGAAVVSPVSLLRWIVVVALFAAAVKTYGSEKPFTVTDVTYGILGSLVFPSMYSTLFLLRMQEGVGQFYVMTPFCVAFAGDALSLYFGMWMGKKKLAPHVSPNKTWAGFWGGPIGAALALCLVGFLAGKLLPYEPDFLMLVLSAAIANMIGQLGDLSMSLIKRENGIKDYGHLFLAHGGVLDKFDSTMFVAPVMYFFVMVGII